jgi:uncharacterized protein (TIGR00369 family)
MTTTAPTPRTGPFWDAVAGRAPLPPAAASLGLEFVAADVDAGTIDLTFTATEAFTTPMGDVLGGFLAAMLYDTVGPCVLATLAPDQFIDTLALQTSFVGPARPGRLTGHGRIVRRAGDVALVEASLEQPAGHPVATGTATIRVMPLRPEQATP